ncbi:MAG: hypothetical protein IT442_12350 [Phycisphaeraceae bacterium]|nr:hypothetical protein [Phycisphaeraceae bacterium]
MNIRAFNDALADAAGPVCNSSNHAEDAIAELSTELYNLIEDIRWKELAAGRPGPVLTFSDPAPSATSSAGRKLELVA